MRPSGAKIEVVPDWVCEVLSTNRRKDLVHKRHVLHARGVRHYWLADPYERTHAHAHAEARAPFGVWSAASGRGADRETNARSPP